MRNERFSARAGGLWVYKRPGPCRKFMDPDGTVATGSPMDKKDAIEETFLENYREKARDLIR